MFYNIHLIVKQYSLTVCLGDSLIREKITRITSVEFSKSTSPKLKFSILAGPRKYFYKVESILGGATLNGLPFLNGHDHVAKPKSRTVAFIERSPLYYKRMWSPIPQF